MIWEETEPQGDVRKAAQAMWQTYCALRQAGFTEDQAMGLILGMMMHRE